MGSCWVIVIRKWGMGSLFLYGLMFIRLVWVVGRYYERYIIGVLICAGELLVYALSVAMPHGGF